MTFDLVNWCKDNQVLCFILIIVILQFSGFVNVFEIFNNILQSCGLEGFELGSNDSQGVGGISPSEQLGQNETSLGVTGLGRTPSSCYPQQTLKPGDLLPTDESILQGVNLLDSSYHVGVNTVGQSLRNANRQLRSEPPNPQVNVSPWMNTTINPDLPRRPLEIGESCPVSQ